MADNKGKILIFSAASGAGKSTILSWLQNRLPQLVYSISATTRKPRGEEKDGVHYFFLDKEEFEAKIQQNEFAEWANVHGNYYGTPKSFINKNISEGRTVVMDIDVQGTANFRRSYPESIGIFLMAPSAAELERRLRSRGTDSEESIATRLSDAEGEVLFAKNSGDYSHFITNDDLDRCENEVLELVTKITGLS